MRNLYDDYNPTQSAIEELLLAGVTDIKTNSADCEFGVQGKLGDWTFERRRSYWAVCVEEDVDGLPLKAAVKLHNTVNNHQIGILGNIVRAGGHAGGICPTSYVSQPIYNEELNGKLMELGYEKIYSKVLNKWYIPISYGEVAELCNQGKLNVQRYVGVYHIDKLIGLQWFVKFVKELEKESSPSSNVSIKGVVWECFLEAEKQDEQWHDEDTCNLIVEKLKPYIK